MLVFIIDLLRNKVFYFMAKACLSSILQQYYCLGPCYFASSQFLNTIVMDKTNTKVTSGQLRVHSVSPVFKMRKTSLVGIRHQNKDVSYSFDGDSLYVYSKLRNSNDTSRVKTTLPFSNHCFSVPMRTSSYSG